MVRAEIISTNSDFCKIKDDFLGYWVGDGYCDDLNNNEGCEWDGGDCCNNDNDSWNLYCTACECREPVDPTSPTTRPTPRPSPTTTTTIHCEDNWTLKKCLKAKKKGACGKPQVSNNCKMTCKIC